MNKHENVRGGGERLDSQRGKVVNFSFTSHATAEQALRWKIAADTTVVVRAAR